MRVASDHGPTVASDVPGKDQALAGRTGREIRIQKGGSPDPLGKGSVG